MSGNVGNGTRKWTRYAARSLSLAWACLWLVFGLLSGAGEGAKGLIANAPNALPGVFFLASAVLAWRWQRTGGLILLAEAILLAIGYPLLMHRQFPVATLLFTLAFIAIPPLVSGLLFLLARPRTSAEDVPVAGVAAADREGQE